VFLVPVATGLTIGLTRLPEFISAVASFFVTDPVKQVNVDRGYSVDSTSQVNVYDDEAINGYVLKARLSPAVDAEFTVRIWSANSAICTVANPCQLTANDMVIYGNGTNSATIDNTGSGGTLGDVIDFDVRINASMALPVGINDVDIIYTKERAYTMQAFNTAMCNAMPIFYPAGSPPAGSEVDLVDIRDGKVYKIRKLPSNTIGTTGWCWMVDNLALQPTQANPMILDSTNSDLTAGTYTLTGANVTDPNSGSYCNALSTTTFPHKCGMQYAWTVAVVGNNPASGTVPDSICPKNWRLPANGEYTTLQTALAWGSSGANVNSLAGFRGLYAGSNGTTSQGTAGYYWSATAYTAASAYGLNYSASNVNPSYSNNNTKTNTVSLRCLAR
jgi:uncharacterized protein (TIGR02145 family)